MLVLGEMLSARSNKLSSVYDAVRYELWMDVMVVVTRAEAVGEGVGDADGNVGLPVATLLTVVGAMVGAAGSLQTSHHKSIASVMASRQAACM